MEPSQWIPMRWPAEWQDPAALDRLRGTPVNCLVAPPAPVAKRATEAGLAVVDLANLPESVLCLTKAVWPGVRAPGAGQQDASAGPTGVPWADSNGWLIRMAQALAPGKTIWTVFDPPKDTVLTLDSYVLAAADSAAYGGHWVVSAGALDSLGPVARALSFFEKHTEWRTYEPLAALGVVSDFAGANEFAGGEALNLLARRHQPYRVLEKKRVSQAALAGLKAVIYVDQEQAAPELQRTLVGFTASGGLLIVPKNWSPPAGAQTSPETHPRYRILKLGAGRIAIAREEVEDPYLLAADSHVLMSRRNDLVRAFNASSTNSYYLRSQDGKRALVEMINYATSPGDMVSVWVMGAYRQARFLAFDGETSLKPIAVRNGTELHLPPFRVYAAIELEK